MDNSTEAIIALVNPYKEAFDTSINANFKTIALITKENNPKVKNVIGSDNNFSKGLTVKLSTPNINVNINKAWREPMYILSTKWDTRYKDRAFTTMNSDIFFIFKISFQLKLNNYIID